MTKHLALSPSEAADRLAIRELIFASAAANRLRNITPRELITFNLVRNLHLP
jgi:hypothetical protein